MARTRKLRWMPLDNAAKIYPAAKRQNWINIFRVSATLTEQVDTAILRAALDVTVERFPYIAARLRRASFGTICSRWPMPRSFGRKAAIP